MLVRLLKKMIYVLVLCPILLAAGVQTLTIDSQLGTSIEDCFERISIGEQLPSDSIYRNVTELTTRECEHICKQDKKCQSYDYGVGAKGNATCELSNLDEKEIKDKSLLKRHPDYDVYIRRFQCEQSPPSPIQQQFDDPEPDPEKPEGSHRPIFRPDDEKYDYLVSGDIRPPGDKRPSYRPDDYSNPKPDYDSGPSYGSHRPQEIPYSPERPSLNQSYNSRPGDQLQFQGYGPDRPNKPYGDESPNYQYVIRPTRRPYQMQDEYRPRPDPYNPNEPVQSSGYGQNEGHPSGPIGPPDRPYRPNRPYDKPNKPYAKPDGYGQKPDNDHSIYVEIYDPPRPYKPVDDPYGIQGYGTYSSQNLYDYSPEIITEMGAYNFNNRPPLGRPQKPNNSYYGSEGTGGYGLQKPQKPYEKPLSSAYGEGSYGGSQSSYGSSQTNFGSSQASYDSSHVSQGSQNNYGSSPGSYQSSQSTHGSSQSSYGSSQSSYGSTQNNYGIQSGSGNDYNSNNPYQGGDNRPNSDPVYQRPQKPTTLRPPHGIENIYGSSQETYESNQSLHSSSQSHYNNHHSTGSQAEYNKPSYHPDDYQQKPQKPYGKPPYNENSYGGSSGTYGGSQPPYGSSSSSYGGNQPPYDSKPGSYGNDESPYSNRPGSHGNSESSYGNRPGSYGNSEPSYGNKPGPYGNSESSYGNRPGSYGNSQSSYDSNQSTYGGSQLTHASGQGSYGSNKPLYGNNQDSYGSSHRPDGSNRPYYGSNEPNYGSSQGSYGNNQASNGNQDSYGSNQNSYGGSQGSYENSQESYGGSQSSLSSQNSYGNSESYYTNRPTSGQNRPKPNYESQNTGGYTNKKPDKNQYGSESGAYERPGYGKPDNGSDYLAYPGVKPVYEFETDRPNDAPSYIAKPGGSVVTARPLAIGDYGDRPGYRGPGKEVSYEACFRRVLAGRRALRSNVHKAISCETLEECRRECATEIRFPCESFNYRIDRSFRDKGLCELMTKPIEAFDLRRDFVDDKDYDFYERDRNSLEPNCPDTLRGPGLLHSGYLSSKSDRVSDHNRWADRNDWFYGKNDRYQGYDRFDRRDSGNKYYDDRFYIPYQIGVGRNDEDKENWGRYGGYYGGYKTYYKDIKDYRESINHWRITNERDRYYGVRPLTTRIEHERSYTRPAEDTFNYNSLAKSLPWSDRYGYGSWKKNRWNSSGVTWDGSHYEFTQHGIDSRSDDGDTRDCSSRRSPGMSLGSGAIRRSLIAPNVVECEAACFSEREFKCVSYSYRYSNSHGSDNCFLSERPYRGLELSADSGSDVYAMPQDQGCVSINYKPWVESECFWHVRSGAAVSDVSARAALTVAGLGACEAECIRANGFFCRGFSFRFEAPTIGDDLENCILTSSPPTSLEIGRGLRSNPGHELYSRGNYGRGCEPALYDDTHHHDSSQCYLKYDSASKLTGSAIRGRARAKDEQSCGVACTDAPFRCLSFSYNNNSPPDADNCFLSEIRLFDLQKGVDYVHSSDDWLFAFDLFNGQCWRRVHGKGDYEIPSSELPRPLSASNPDELYSLGPGPSGTGYLPEPQGPVYISSSVNEQNNHYSTSGHASSAYELNYSASKPGFKPGYPIESSGPGYKPGYPGETNDYRPAYADNTGYKPGYIPESSYKPSYPGNRPSYDFNSDYKPGFRPLKDEPYPDRDRPGYKPGYISGKPGYIPDRPGSQPVRPQTPVQYGDRESELAVSWRHYTVSGFPCRTGTACAQNHVAGHWACEPEGGEYGSWDYCCAPTHRCGYSEGFHKPWCYVGPAQDQWRPCSEKYYPYHQHSEPHPSYRQTAGNRVPTENSQRPSKPWNDRPGYAERPQGPYLSEADRNYWDELYRNGPQAYYDKYGNPLPGYSRVPTAERPYIKYSHNYPRPGGGQWVAVPPPQPEADRNHPGLGVPRYWPVAYLHKGPPPNITYFRYNETSITTDKSSADLPAQSRDQASDVNIDLPRSNDIDKHRDEKKRNISEPEFRIIVEPTTTFKTVTTEASPMEERKEEKMNYSIVDATKPTKIHDKDTIEGIDDKLLDFSRSIEVFDIEDRNRHEKSSNLKMLEAEERQIEEIGRLLAARREGKLVLEKRSQKDLESKSIAVDRDMLNFNFGNRFPITERKGVIQKLSKDELERERNTDKSLEVSETTFVRPPRILNATDNIRKAIVNGRVFYDASAREQRDLHSNSTRRSKSLRSLEEKAPSVFSSANFGRKKVINTRNINPVRRVRRVYKKRYNPEEVRKRLLDREKNLKESSENSKNS